MRITLQIDYNGNPQLKLLSDDYALIKIKGVK